ncbi:hypothetical protein TWF694_004067 [Orbilia ellipsospora]|uniref:Uncharacterized protein n=1 Tax=Orbilia ellipsospora TaxID=2528407 RepID=A0AAV9WWV6_9PEZI
MQITKITTLIVLAMAGAASALPVEAKPAAAAAAAAKPADPAPAVSKPHRFGFFRPKFAFGTAKPEKTVKPAKPA